MRRWRGRYAARASTTSNSWLSPSSGARVNIVANARPLRDLGNLRGAVTVLRDVTEQKRAHQALVDSEQMAQSIVSSSLDAFVQTNQDGVILDWSPQAEVLTGWTRAEVLGLRAVDLVFLEADRAATRQRIERFLEEVAGGAVGMRYESQVAAPGWPRIPRRSSRSRRCVAVTVTSSTPLSGTSPRNVSPKNN